MHKYTQIDSTYAALPRARSDDTCCSVTCFPPSLSNMSWTSFMSVPSCGSTSQTSGLHCMPGSPGPCVCSTVFLPVPRSPARGGRSISNCFAYARPTVNICRLVSVYFIYTTDVVQARASLAQYQELKIQCTEQTRSVCALTEFMMLQRDRTGNTLVLFCFVSLLFLVNVYIKQSHEYLPN